MFTYQQQLAKCKDTTDDYSNIWKSSVWTITDYEELFEDIDRGYIIQSQEANYFIINPDWEEEEEEYENRDDEEEENKCWGNNKCERDEFGCCIVCCECKECIKRIKEEHATLEEEVEDSDDEDCVAHPVYKCDGGCGTIMGSDDDCKRICDDCEEDSDDEEEEIELKVEPPINLWDSLLEQQQKDILKSQSVWKIYFGAVLQDIREPNWREEEKEKKKCRECEVVITKDNIYEPEDFHENCDLCDKCGDYYKECVVCDEWTVEDECYRDKDGDAINLCNVCGDSEYQKIEENVEKINQFVKNYERGEYIGFYSTEIDAIMKFINKFHKRW